MGSYTSHTPGTHTPYLHPAWRRGCARTELWEAAVQPQHEKWWEAKSHQRLCSQSCLFPSRAERHKNTLLSLNSEHSRDGALTGPLLSYIQSLVMPCCYVLGAGGPYFSDEGGVCDHDTGEPLIRPDILHDRSF